MKMAKQIINVGESVMCNEGSGRKDEETIIIISEEGKYEWQDNMK